MAFGFLHFRNKNKRLINLLSNKGHNEKRTSSGAENVGA
jgi:hypothetical protein